MREIFEQMPRAIKVIFILYILFLFQSISNIFPLRVFQPFYFFGFILPGSFYFIYQLVYGLVYFMNAFLIIKRLGWGLKFIITTEVISFINALLYVYKTYSINPTTSVMLVYIGTTIFGTLMTGLIIYYLNKNKEYFYN